MSRPRVFEWHKLISEGRKNVKEDDQPDRPRTPVNVKKKKKVRLVIRNGRTVNIRATAGMVNLKRGSVRRNLTS
jgi:hypothetical protein